MSSTRGPGAAAHVDQIASVIIPAHNEQASIARLLAMLDTSQLEIVVVSNGSSDRTAEVARSFEGVNVICTSIASKQAAIELGDESAHLFPRFYVDADVEIDTRSVVELVRALGLKGRLAVAPSRSIPRAGVSALVSAYYDIWERLPGVRAGLFGRGVIGLSEQGFDRIRALPKIMADDLALSEAFQGDERAVVPDAIVTVHPPRRLADLLRRRIRAHTGNVEADRSGVRSAAARTRWSDLTRTARVPALAIKLPVFLTVTVAARIGARRSVRNGDFTTWLRDESSRQPSLPDRPDDIVVWQAGVDWEGVTGTDRHLVSALTSAGLDIVWVDPPQSVAGWFRHRSRPWRICLQLRQVGEHLWRLSPPAPPFPHRRGIDVLTTRLVGMIIRRATRRAGRRVTAVVGTSPHPRLRIIDGARKIYFATDDFTAGALLMGKSPRRFARLERDRLDEADAVGAISAQVALRWTLPADQVTIIPNGCDVAHYVNNCAADPALAPELAKPVVGLVGQLSARIDLDILEQIVESGLSLLIVGPRDPGFETERVKRLLSADNVFWAGQRPFAELPAYLRRIDVGVTPYVVNDFNNASFPLKTLEYLAAGKPVISTPLPSVAALGTDLVVSASEPEKFVEAIRAVSSLPSGREQVSARRGFARMHSWQVRAEAFQALLQTAADAGPGLPAQPATVAPADGPSAHRLSTQVLPAAPQ